jgi:crotonobetainyl-CoA:carnitine CoA-transferase CaiB-like acyl-CoA transferase
MFETSDGWIVAGGSKEKFWRDLAVALGREDLIQDPRFVDFPARRANRDALQAELGAVFALETTRHWVGELTRQRVPCAPVNTVAQALDDPQAVARHSVVETLHPRFETVKSVAAAVRAGPLRTEHLRAPFQGEHTREVLAEVCGYSTDEIDGLLQAGVIMESSRSDS